ncbi:MAG: hypothetical protein GX606_02730 [Elusimicrobia bacterium]|nr:hypothetical protein [Elusimicrobiota bacterium]
MRRRNYSFGKVPPNDYIQVVNAFDTNRLNKMARVSCHKKLFVEWSRLADRLVRSADIRWLQTGKGSK